MTSKIAIAMAVAAGLAAGCGSKMGAEIRGDIQARMESAQPALQACYASALKTNRKLRGMITLEFIAEPSTGQFKNVLIRRDELNDQSVRQCVIAEVGRLKLAKPSSTSTAISYPIRFTPNN